MGHAARELGDGLRCHRDTGERGIDAEEEGDPRLRMVMELVDGGAGVRKNEAKTNTDPPRGQGGEGSREGEVEGGGFPEVVDDLTRTCYPKWEGAAEGGTWTSGFHVGREGGEFREDVDDSIRTCYLKQEVSRVSCTCSLEKGSGKGRDERSGTNCTWCRGSGAWRLLVDVTDAAWCRTKIRHGEESQPSVM